MRISRTSEWDRMLPSGRGLERVAESFGFGAISAFGRVIGEANTKWNERPADKRIHNYGQPRSIRRCALKVGHPTAPSRKLAHCALRKMPRG